MTVLQVAVIGIGTLDVDEGILRRNVRKDESSRASDEHTSAKSADPPRL